MQSVPEFDINTLYQEAHNRWLKPPEVYFILQNHERYQLNHKAPQNPTSGSLLLFNKRVLKFFRKDGHQWRRKKDGRAIAEAHERLKVGTVEALNCYYAHGEHNPTFQRRIYWMLDPAYEHIVLVHYRDVSEGKESKLSSGKALQFPPNASILFSSPSSIVTQNANYNLYASDVIDRHQLSSNSPATAEINSEIVYKTTGVETPEDSTTNSSEFEVRQALKRLEEQLSIGDDTVATLDPVYIQEESLDNLQVLECRKDIDHFDQPVITVHHRSENNKLERCYGGYVGTQYHSNNLMLEKNDSGGKGVRGEQESGSWKDVLESCEAPRVLNFECGSTANSSKGLQEDSNWSYSSQFDQSSLFVPQELPSFEVPGCYSAFGDHETNAEYCRMMAEEEKIVAHKQKFAIQDLAPDWGYADETTKVIIVGSFLCDSRESTWSCMFGDTEVPSVIIKEGVLRCEAPPHRPGKVTLCITSGDRVSCSQVITFEYRDKATTCFPRCILPQTCDISTSPDELLLLVKFVESLLVDPLSNSKNNTEQDTNMLLKKLKADDDQWIEAIFDGDVASATTVNWLLQELLKDKLDAWLSSRSQDKDQVSCSLSKQEQGIIHMAAGLGFEWALYSILDHGVSVDFRDINGWSALHWAARFGREKMVAALIARGASAGAVTDPTSQDSDGKTAASIAASNGHKGLAGYLSEVALTNHLLSLTLEETEISKDSAQVQAEITVNFMTEPSLPRNEDQLSLAAVRNAAQAAARIQAAFRAHSFRKRRQREAAMVSCFKEYGIYCRDIEEMAAISKLVSRNARNYHSAALSIQKNYRRWKGRKIFLSLREKVIKIQAHVRGYQVRKHYKVICWAVGVLDKVVLRWRRKGAGLRGFRQDVEATEDSEEDDILKVFRKKKVDGAVNEAFSRVLSMANSPEARQQYHRVLKRYCQTKAELGKTETLREEEDGDGDGLFDIADMENDDLFSLP